MILLGKNAHLALNNNHSRTHVLDDKSLDFTTQKKGDAEIGL